MISLIKVGCKTLQVGKTFQRKIFSQILKHQKGLNIYHNVNVYQIYCAGPFLLKRDMISQKHLMVILVSIALQLSL